MKKKYKEYKSGYYRPENQHKFDVERCVYRSAWERDFLRWADRNEKVLSVQYERTVIPYKCATDNKLHRYYVDVKLVLEENGKPVTYLIEIKPFKKTLPPTESKRKKATTLLFEKVEWVKNSCKWKSAEQYCKHRGYKWCILTEKGMYVDGKFHSINIFK